MTDPDRHTADLLAVTMADKTPEQLCLMAAALLQNHEPQLALKVIRQIDYQLSTRKA